jgi:endonuclease III related protein
MASLPTRVAISPHSALTCVATTRYVSEGMMKPEIATEESAVPGQLMEDRFDSLAKEESRSGAVLPSYYATLSKTIGPRRWWPARTPFEVIVGAILTQNTAWRNVEKAMVNLRRERLLTPQAMERVSTQRLAGLVRPSGYFRQKAKKLKAFVRFLRNEYGGSLRRMFATPTLELREQLLGVFGIGPETADSILLYAGGHPIFVVDAYTHRILGRHGISSTGKPDYEAVRAMFEANLPADARLYSEFHALLVNVGKNWCRPRDPRCSECPLKSHLPADSLHHEPGAASLPVLIERPS